MPSDYDRYLGWPVLAMPSAMSNKVFSNTTTPSSASPPSMAELKAMAAKIEARSREDDRKVFVFDGTFGEFRKAISGFAAEIHGDPRWPMTPGLHSGLEVREVMGKVYVGTEKAIRAYLPFLFPIPLPEMDIGKI